MSINNKQAFQMVSESLGNRSGKMMMTLKKIKYVQKAMKNNEQIDNVFDEEVQLKYRLRGLDHISL